MKGNSYCAISQVLSMATTPTSRLPDILSQGFNNLFDVSIFAGNDAWSGKVFSSDNQMVLGRI
jgi:hypothetical protein